MSCGCGKPKPCPDGTCPHKRRAPNTRLMPFSLWVTNYAPVVPKFYWDVESQEQRIYHLSLELDRLRAYINYIFCEVEKLANELAEALDRAEALLDELAAKIREVEQLISELRQVIADINARMNAVEAEFARIKQQAQRAEQTANEAKSQAQQANTKADAAQTAAQQANTKADAAQTAAQNAQGQAQQALAQLDLKVDKNQYNAEQAIQDEKLNALGSDIRTAIEALATLTNSVNSLEACCSDARNRLTALETWRRDLEERIAPLFIDPENPDLNIRGVEVMMEVNRGPILDEDRNPIAGSVQRYASVLSLTIPLSGIMGNSVEVDSLTVIARLGSWIAFNDGNNPHRLLWDNVPIVENGVWAPWIQAHYIHITPYTGITIQMQFNQSLQRAELQPDNNTTTYQYLVNATNASGQIYLQGRVI